MMLASIGDSLKVWTPDESQPGSLAVKTRFASRSDLTYHSLCWSHNNKVVAVGGSEPKVDLVRVKNAQLLLSLSLSESKLSNVQVRAVAFSPDSRYLACALGSPIQLWDMEAPNIKAVFTGHTHHIVSLQFTSAGTLFAADKSGKIKLWTSGNSSPIHELPAEGKRQLTCMMLSPIEPLLAAGFADGGLKVWNSVSSGGPADTLVRNQQCHSDRVTAIACSTRNARLISTVSADGKLQLVDLGSKTPSELTAVCDTREALTALAFHEDGVHCAVGTATGNISLFDWRSLRQPLLTLSAHTPHAVSALAYQAPHTKAKDLSFSHASAASTASSKASAPAASTPTPRASEAAPWRGPAAQPPVQLETAPPARPATSVPAPETTTPPRAERTTEDLRPAPLGLPRSAGDDITPPPRKPLHAASPISRPLSSSSASAPTASTTTTTRTKDTAPTLPTPRESTASLPLSTSHRPASLAGESLMEGAVGAKPAASLPEEKPPVASPSSFMARVQAHLEVGGHPRPSLTSEISPTAALDSSVDLHFQHAKLHTQLDRMVHRSADSMLGSVHNDNGAQLDELRHSVKPVTAKELEDALELLRYDLHNELQDVIQEQVRQFVIAKEETAQLVRELSCQLADLLQANKELRAENERLRRIY